MENFPGNLLALREGFSEDQPSNLHETEVEQGQPKASPKGSRGLVERPIKYLATTKADYLSWKTWFRTNVRWGADWFNWVDPVDSVTKKARVKAGTYKAEPASANLEHWDISFTLILWEI